MTQRFTDTSAYTRIHRGKVVDATPAPTPMPMIKFNPFDAKRRKAKSDAQRGGRYRYLTKREQN